MKYNIRGNKLDVTEAINDYIEDKLSKLEKYLDDNDEVEAKALISARGKNQKVEVTIWSGKYNIRAEETNPDLYSAIDLVVDKLERQFKKYRGKLNNRKNAREEYVPSIEIEEYEEYENETIVRKKEDRIYIEKGNSSRLGDVAYFTFEPHISIPGSKYGYKKENIYYFKDGKIEEL